MVVEKERQTGGAEKSPSKIIDETLSQISRSSTFLPNIGASRRSKSAQTSSTVLSMQAQFEETLQAEREEAARTKEELQADLQAQKELLRQTQDQVKDINSRFEETNALLRAVLNLQKQ
jgi:hypothetical protein